MFVSHDPCAQPTADVTRCGPVTHGESVNWLVNTSHLITIFLKRAREGAQLSLISRCCTLEPKRIVELELELAL